MLYIVWKGLCQRDIVLRLTHLYEASKATIIDYLKWLVVFHDPADEFSTVKVPKAYQICCRWSMGQAYCASILVCWQVLYTAFPLLIFWNASVIDPFLLALRPSNVAHMALTSWEPSAASTASSLQQILAGRCRLLVDLASLLSRNRQTKRVLQPHVGAAHSKTWDLQPWMLSWSDHHVRLSWGSWGLGILDKITKMVFRRGSFPKGKSVMWDVTWQRGWQVKITQVERDLESSKTLARDLET